MSVFHDGPLSLLFGRSWSLSVKCLVLKNRKDLECSFFGNYLGRFLCCFLVVVDFYLSLCTARDVVVCHCRILLFLTPQRNSDNVSRLLGNNSIWCLSQGWLCVRVQLSWSPYREYRSPLLSIKIRPSFLFFSKRQGPRSVLCEEQAVHGQVVCLCTQLQIRHVMAEIIMGSDPVAIQVGIFHSR